MKQILYLLPICLFLSACNGIGGEEVGPELSGPMFKLLSQAETGIDFANEIEENDSLNYFRWMYFYNGGGVAIGDINNDDLPDIYLTGNQVPNKLYLNKGKLKFEDITQKAGVAGSNWSTGVTMADVNADGFLDIYVVRGGPFLHNLWDRTNLLYINNGDLTFTERAKEWHCNDAAFGIHATFLDYDLDGDLDLYTVNHPASFGAMIDFRLARHFKPQSFESGRFFRNEGDRFTDITDSTGVLRYAFGLSATAADLNQDGYPDLYVANDFSEPDFLFINQGDGTFREAIKEMTGHISNFGMGNDVADYNNDGYLDVMVLDMMAENNRRKKTNMSGMNPDIFWRNVANGFHYQYMQNTLLLNHGNGWMSDVAQLAGVSTTDWSWGPLLADFDNDGWQDLFITNGSRRDARDNDYAKKVEKLGGEAIMADYKTGLGYMPEEKLPNYMYRNNGDMTFDKVTVDWGLDQPTWSNGAAYADLDADGDLDLVVSNLEERAMVYENRAQQMTPQNWLRVRLRGQGKNRNGLGAKVTLHDQKGNVLQMREMTLSRGYQSSVEPILHFGLGEMTSVPQLKVYWPGGKEETLDNVKAGQVFDLLEKDAQPGTGAPAPTKATPFTIDSTRFADYRHDERPYDDFQKEILLPHRLSQLGPFASVGDLNGDGTQDLFVGGAFAMGGWAYISQPKGDYTSYQFKKMEEDMGSCIFDANGDGKMDLFVVSGSNEFPAGSERLRHRLYLTEGSARVPFPSQNTMPDLRSAGSVAVNADYDDDGDQDLFVGGRVSPGAYPFAPQSYLLENDGKGNFTDVATEKAPGLSSVGMVTDALWLDIDRDRDLDLVLAGEWMPVTIFKNDKGKFTNTTEAAGLSKATGWWFSLAAEDLDHDGDKDIVAGNMGLNTKFPASEKQPFHIYCHDFDHNGTLDIVLAYYNEGQVYPVRGRTCSSQQMPFLKEKFPTYKEFANANIRDVYGSALDSALHLQATTLASSVLLNDGKGNFTVHALPNMAQLSAVNGILIGDFWGDRDKDILIAGNMHGTEVETSRADAGVGLLLEGDGKGGFRPIPTQESGFFAPGDVKDLVEMTGPDGSQYVIATVNNGPLKVWKVMKRGRPL